MHDKTTRWRTCFATLSPCHLAILSRNGHPQLIVQTRVIEALVKQRYEARDLGLLLEANVAENALGALHRRQCVVGHQNDRYLAILGAVDHRWRGADITG